MTKLLEQAFERVLALPLEMQDQAARMLLAYAGDEEPILALTPKEEPDLIEAQAEMQRGEFATDAEARLTAMLTLLQLQSFVGRKTSISGVRRVFLTISVPDRLLRWRR